MPAYHAHIVWRCSGSFLKGQYSRVHQWCFDEGVSIKASSSPHIVPPPLSDPQAIDPEEAFVAAIASCHMLWFLYWAQKEGWSVSHYEDRPEGTLEFVPQGGSMKAIQLRPLVGFEGPSPEPTQIERVHQRAHQSCFLASSVRFPIAIQAQTNTKKEL